MVKNRRFPFAVHVWTLKFGIDFINDSALLGRRFVLLPLKPILLNFGSLAQSWKIIALPRFMVLDSLSFVYRHQKWWHMLRVIRDLGQDFLIYRPWLRKFWWSKAGLSHAQLRRQSRLQVDPVHVDLVQLLSVQRKKLRGLFKRPESVNDGPLLAAWCDSPLPCWLEACGVVWASYTVRLSFGSHYLN